LLSSTLKIEAKQTQVQWNFATFLVLIVDIIYVDCHWFKL